MSLKPIPGFTSLTTHHCVTGSMRHIYEFHDCRISEDLLLGLGAGVGFIYWHMKGMPPMLGGRANVGRPGEEGLEKTAGRRTGVRVESFHTTSARKAEASLLEMLDAGEPVMVQLDMGFLPYFDLPEDFHFGGHVVVVAGHDAEAGTVLIADRDEELHPISLEDLATARGSKFKPFPPRHAWYTFDFTEKRPPEPDEVCQAIAEVATGMLEPPITNIGVKGIRKAADRVLKWPGIMDDDQLRWACFNTFIFIDATGGTGG
ncbi:MAG: BtrH N-terminal domain-containing protein, partial [Armatimonadota bacterium]